MIGLTSVTFRKHSIEDIIAMGRKTKIDVVEWGSDVHLPPGKYHLAKRIAGLARIHNIKSLSYGSYYKLGVFETTDEFETYAKTAHFMGGSEIRIWTSDLPNKRNTQDLLDQNVEELKALAVVADKYDLTIGLEYHRNSLTESAEMTKYILQAVNHQRVRTYWQMNPDLSHEKRLEEIRALKEYIINCHVFYWKKDKEGEDLPCALSDGVAEWREYIQALKGRECKYMIEFVKGDSVEQFIEDINTLKRLVNEA